MGSCQVLLSPVGRALGRYRVLLSSRLDAEQLPSAALCSRWGAGAYQKLYTAVGRALRGCLETHSPVGWAVCACLALHSPIGRASGGCLVLHPLVGQAQGGCLE